MIVLDGSSLTVGDVVAVAERTEPVRISSFAVSRMHASRARVEDAMCGSTPVYALNTGVGLLANIRLNEPELEQMQVNLVRSHCCGVGEPLSTEAVRGMMLIRANVLAKGLSGIRPVIAERICDLLNHDITPVIPSRGSVGASGDLAPLAHMALVLIGEGYAQYRGDTLPGGKCLERAGLTPLKLLGKEGISLLNGTQAMLSIGCLQLAALERLFYAAQTTAALTMEALRGTAAALDPQLHAARPHPGQVLSARHLAGLLKGSQIPRTQGESNRIQDAYCLRCIPQVHGAAWDTLAEAKRVFSIELNSATDNPLVFEDSIVSGGNFHGAPLALALDYLAIAMCQIAGISERRTERLLNPTLNEGLPPVPCFCCGAGVGADDGTGNGGRSGCGDARSGDPSLHRFDSNERQPGGLREHGHDLGAETTAGGAHMRAMVVAIELLTATRALDLRGDTSTTALEEAKRRFRHRVPAWKDDCVLSVWMEESARFLAETDLRSMETSSAVEVTR